MVQFRLYILLMTWTQFGGQRSFKNYFSIDDLNQKDVINWIFNEPLIIFMQLQETYRIIFKIRSFLIKLIKIYSNRIWSIELLIL